MWFWFSVLLFGFVDWYFGLFVCFAKLGFVGVTEIGCLVIVWSWGFVIVLPSFYMSLGFLLDKCVGYVCYLLFVGL